MMDWDPGNVVITGGTDGVVRMWSLEYVQVPVSTSLCSAAHSSGDLSETHVACPQPGFESVSSVCESSNLEEDEFYQDEVNKTKLLYYIFIDFSLGLAIC